MQAVPPVLTAESYGVIYKAYVICTSPRSGSTLLCTLLRAAQGTGWPDSYFHKPSVSDWARARSLTLDPAQSSLDQLQTVVNAAVKAGRGGDSIFGLRLQRPSFEYFSDRLAILHPQAATTRAAIEATFGPTLFIHLHRADKVAQAVSLLKASQSGLWHVARDGSELERGAPPAEPAYDGAALRAHVEELTEADTEWRGWFARDEIHPLTIAYDDLSADPIRQLHRVLDALGFPHDAAEGVSPGTARLADATSAEWVTRFRAEAGIG